MRSIPAEINPLDDETGENCDIEQKGPVFFLVGTRGGSAKRTCHVPEEKALFFPLVTAMFSNTAPPGQDPGNATEDVKRVVLDDLFNSRACNLDSTLDGRPTLLSAIATVRTQSPAFRIEIGPNDVFGDEEGGVDDAAVSDGFWVMLNVPEGEHTLHFRGALCDLDTDEEIFSVEVTYQLIVGDEND